MLTIKVFAASNDKRQAKKSYKSFLIDPDVLSPKEQLQCVVRDAQKWADENTTVFTFSEHVVNGVRIAVKRRFIGPADVMIEFHPHGDRSCETIRVDSKGSLSSYPDGFMDAWNVALIQLMAH